MSSSPNVSPRSTFSRRLAVVLFLALAGWLILSSTMRHRLVEGLHRPDFAITFFFGGMLLVYWEFNRPGTVVPGATGALLIMFGVYGLTLQTLRPAAALPILLGLTLILAELRWSTRYLAASVGVITLAAGLRQLILSPPSVHAAVAFLAAFTFGGATVLLGKIALRARRNKLILRSERTSGSSARPNTAGLACERVD